MSHLTHARSLYEVTVHFRDKPRHVPKATWQQAPEPLLTERLPAHPRRAPRPRAAAVK